MISSDEYITRRRIREKEPTVYISGQVDIPKSYNIMIKSGRV
jgi:hypothetical protein